MSGSNGKGSGWQRLEDNIYGCKDANRRKPFLWKQTIEGALYREFFYRIEDARAAKNAKLESVQKYGAIAHEFDKDAFTEWREGRKRLPAGVSIVEACEFYARHHAGVSDSSITIETAYTEFLKSKLEDRRRMKKTPLSREHLSDLRWRGRLLVARFGHAKPSAVSSKQLLGLYSDSANSGRSILNAHETLRNFFNWCRRKRYVARSPYEEIGPEDLPDKGTGQKHPLPLWSVVEMFAFFEARFPRFLPWLNLRLFAGIRSKEAQRFRPEWIHPERRLIRMPGWSRAADGTLQPGPKTRDDWVIYGLPDSFWAWHGAYPTAARRETVLFPHTKLWPKIREEMIGQGIIDRFESNAFRDTFCTLMFSGDPDPARIAANMKHRNPNTMFESYLGSLRPEWEGRAFRSVYPGIRRINV